MPSREGTQAGATSVLRSRDCEKWRATRLSTIDPFYSWIYFINANIGVLSGRFLSMEVVIKTFILLVEAFVGQIARPLHRRLCILYRWRHAHTLHSYVRPFVMHGVEPERGSLVKCKNKRKVTLSLSGHLLRPHPFHVTSQYVNSVSAVIFHCIVKYRGRMPFICLNLRILLGCSNYQKGQN